MLNWIANLFRTHKRFRYAEIYDDYWFIYWGDSEGNYIDDIDWPFGETEYVSDERMRRSGFIVL